LKTQKRGESKLNCLPQRKVLNDMRRKKNIDLGSDFKYFLLYSTVLAISDLLSTDCEFSK
jgi:hypothetical protein